jgi:hypothetical protein
LPVSLKITGRKLKLVVSQLSFAMIQWWKGDGKVVESLRYLAEGQRKVAEATLGFLSPFFSPIIVLVLDKGFGLEYVHKGKCFVDMKNFDECSVKQYSNCAFLQMVSRCC